MVLSHQTGFPNWRWMNKDEKLHFEFDPGTKYQYSGEGFEYLRKAVEKKTGKNLEELAQELIFKPLKMNDTSYIWNEKEQNRVVIGYDEQGKPYQPVKNKRENAADDLWTTVEDYSKFMVAMLNNKLLSESVFNEMKTGQVETKNQKQFGLGFEIYDLGNQKTALVHSGSDEGVNTIAIILPETKDGLVIFTNVDGGYKVYKTLIPEYLGNAGKKIVEIELN